jgi:hypothetical protein
MSTQKSANRKTEHQQRVGNQNTHHFTKRIGATTFQVNAYFCDKSKETAQDKILRLIQNDVELSRNELGKVANL